MNFINKKECYAFEINKQSLTNNTYLFKIDPQKIGTLTSIDKIYLKFYDLFFLKSKYYNNFAMIQSINILKNSQSIFTITGRQLGYWISTKKKQIFRSSQSDPPTLFIGIPFGAFPDIKSNNVQIKVSLFPSIVDVQKINMSLYGKYTKYKPQFYSIQQSDTYFWVPTQQIQASNIKLNDNDTTKHVTFHIPINKIPLYISQIILDINSNKIKPNYLSNISILNHHNILRQFNNHDFFTMDRELHDYNIVKGPIGTISFCNWTKYSPNEVDSLLIIHPNDKISIQFDIDKDVKNIDIQSMLLWCMMGHKHQMPHIINN
jgi:hypothetical protein